MFGLGLPEILVLLVIFLFIFGAKRLPAIGEGLGKTVKEIRNIRQERREEKERKKEEQKGNVITDLKKEIQEIPGVEEAKAIKEAAKEIKSVTKFLK